MHCEAICWIYQGRLSDWQPASVADVDALLRAFSIWAAAQARHLERPVLPSPASRSLPINPEQLEPS